MVSESVNPVRTRPWRAAGVRRWISVMLATTSSGSAAPKTMQAARTTGRDDEVASSAPRPHSNPPVATARISPSRRIAAAEHSPPAMAPTPWALDSTPRKVGGRPRPWSTTAKNVDSEMPTTEQNSTPTPSSRQSTGVRRMCRRPTAASCTNPASVGSAAASRGWIASRQATETRNVALSTRASACPPNTASRAAPVSGPTSRRASRAVVSEALAVGSSGSSTTDGISAERAEVPTSSAIP